jgi:signal transduction histidine kinase
MAFTFDIPLKCIVNGNASLLGSAILNLIKNSVAYSKGTMMRLEKIGENDKLYTFIFYDNGTGVDEEHLPYLFDRFYRIDAGRSRKVGGTGLGLPIVKNTIRTFGGKISVSNRHQGGLEFRFTLPKA